MSPPFLSVCSSNGILCAVKYVSKREPLVAGYGMGGLNYKAVPSANVEPPLTPVFDLCASICVDRLN